MSERELKKPPLSLAIEKPPKIEVGRVGTDFHRSVMDEIKAIQNALRKGTYSGTDGYPAVSRIYWAGIGNLVGDLSPANVFESSGQTLEEARIVYRDTSRALIEELGLKSDPIGVVKEFKGRTEVVRNFYNAYRSLHRLAARSVTAQGKK